MFLGIQFFRPPKYKQNTILSTDIRYVIPTSQEVVDILDKSCNDCHSNNTNYPWYAEIMPLGWWINQHVVEGKRHLNFSISSSYSIKKLDHKLEEVEEEVKSGNMPPSNYMIIHKNARLNEHEKDVLIHWAKTGRTYLSENSLE